MLSWHHPDQPPDRRFAAVVAGGPLASGHLTSDVLQRASLVIAADKGADHLARLERRPDIVVGDFDSIDRDTLARYEEAGVPTVRVDPEKDFTDSELALDVALREGYDDVALLGWTGGPRLDLSLSNQLVLAAARYAGARLAVLDGEAVAYVVRDRLELAGEPGETVSLVPIAGTALGVSLEGLYYPLVEGQIDQAGSLGVSNHLVDRRASVRLRQGCLLVFHFTHHAKETA